MLDPSGPPSSRVMRRTRLLGVIGLLFSVGIAARVPGVTSQGTSGPVDLVVDPNSAPEPVLIALPNIGPKTLRGIVAARAGALLVSIEDLDRRVRGLGPVRIAELRPFLRFPDSSSR